MADHNYAIVIHEECRTISQQDSTYLLTKDKFDEMLYLREYALTWKEWFRGKKE